VNAGRTRQLTAAPLLLRLDGENDAIENIAEVEAHNEQEKKAAPVQYGIKWNPRQESPEHWLAYAEENGDWSEPHAGKRIALFDVVETRTHDGYEYSLWRVMRVIERTIDKRGQRLLVPEIEIEGWSYTRLTAAEALRQLRAQGFSEEILPCPSTMAEVLNRNGYRLRPVLKAKP
jgi:hypothetical protein